MSVSLATTERILLTVVNGVFAPECSTGATLPPGVVITSLHNAMQTQPKLVELYPMNALADGLFIYIPPKLQLNIPLHLLFLATQADVVLQPQHLIILDEASSATIIEEHRDIGGQRCFTNTLKIIHTAKQAAVDYYKIQNPSARNMHFTNTIIQQKAMSSVKLNHFIFNNQFSRDDIAVALQEPHAQCEARGFYLTSSDEQHVDHQVYIDHQAPFCSSDMLYKGIMRKKSRADFMGKVLVRETAQKTVAQQANHHLLLSAQAQANAKPQLEIYADDVRCKHGATTGELDQESLFYLCSRGIAKEDAVQLLLGGFAADVLQRVPHVDLANYLRELLEGHLHASV